MSFRTVRHWRWTLTLIGLLLGLGLAAESSLVHDTAQRLVTFSDGQRDLVLRLNYNQRCLLDQVVVRGRQVIDPEAGVGSGIRVGGQWCTTRANLASPDVKVAGNLVTVSNIRFGGNGVQVQETWHFTLQPDRILWQIVRKYLTGGTVEDTYFPAWGFADMSTWTGGLLGNGGVAWCKYLETTNATYGVHAGPVTFWSRKQNDCLRIVPTVPDDRHVALRFSHEPGNGFTCAQLVGDREFQPKHGLRRFLPHAQDLWAPFPVVPGETRVSYSLQALNYDEAYDRGTFKGLNGASIRELLNTIGRYGVVDRRLMGGNGWRTGWACLHEQWFAQMGLAINDPDYIANFRATLDDQRDHAIRPDGRVLSRWHHDASDAMPGTWDARTGYYECQWGYTMDSQPDYAICVAEQFDLTGDLAWLRGQKLACERALDYLLRRDADADGLLEMMTDSHTQGKGSDWIDVIWASWENALVNAEMYYAMVLWADLEDLLEDLPSAARYRQAATKLKLRFNRTLAEGGFWNPARQWYVYWRDKDDSIHGDNLVTPVNFAAIAYGLCDDPSRREAILWHIHTQTQKENLFHWPLCFYPYASGEGHPSQYPFPKYENGDIFLSWGELGVRAYAASQPGIALDYVKKVLERYERDGLSFQRYLRASQAGSGDDILAGNCMTIVGLYRDIYGVQPKWNRLYLEPHLTPELDGTRLKYWLRGQWYTIELNTAEQAIAANGLALRDPKPFGLSVKDDTLEYFAGNRSTCSMSVTRATRQPLELRIESWPEDTAAPRRWTELGAGSQTWHRILGAKAQTKYRLLRDGNKLASLTSNAAGEISFETILEGSPTPRRFEIVAE